MKKVLGAILDNFENGLFNKEEAVKEIMFATKSKLNEDAVCPHCKSTELQDGSGWWGDDGDAGIGYFCESCGESFDWSFYKGVD